MNYSELFRLAGVHIKPEQAVIAQRDAYPCARPTCAAGTDFLGSHWRGTTVRPPTKRGALGTRNDRQRRVAVRAQRSGKFAEGARVLSGLDGRAQSTIISVLQQRIFRSSQSARRVTSTRAIFICGDESRPKPAQRNIGFHPHRSSRFGRFLLSRAGRLGEGQRTVRGRDPGAILHAAWRTQALRAPPGQS